MAGSSPVPDTAPPRRPDTAGAGLGDVPTLCRAIRAGDAEAFTTLYALWDRRAVALVQSWTQRDEAFALDASQECFLRVIQSLPVLSSAPALDAWMTTTLRNAVIDLLRRERTRITHEQRRVMRATTPSAAFTVPPEAIAQREQLACLDAALARLTPLEHETLRLRFWGHLPRSALVLRLASTPGAVQGMLRRALLRLSSITQRPNDDE